MNAPAGALVQLTARQSSARNRTTTIHEFLKFAEPVGLKKPMQTIAHEDQNLQMKNDFDKTLTREQCTKSVVSAISAGRLDNMLTKKWLYNQEFWNNRLRRSGLLERFCRHA
jgi:hypothetical protein